MRFGYIGFVWLLALVCMTILVATAHTSIYVSPNGNDAHAGTKKYPVKTITHALTLIPHGGTIQLLPGTYRETISLSETASTDRPITITGEPGKVFLLGSEPSSQLTWNLCTQRTCPHISKAAQPYTYTAHIPWDENPSILAVRPSTIDIQMLNLARSPNTPTSINDKYHEFWWQPNNIQSSLTSIYDPQNTALLSDTSGGRTFVMDGADRCGTYMYVRTIKHHDPYTGTLTVDAPIGADTYGNQETGISKYSKYYIENAPGLLDEKGEWYFDPINRMIYVWPHTRENPSILPLEIGKRSIGLFISRSNVRINGLTIQTINDYLSSDAPSGAIVFDPNQIIKNIRIIDSSIGYSGYGIFAQPTTIGKLHNVRIHNANMQKITKSPLSFIGNADTTESVSHIVIDHSSITQSGFPFNEPGILIARASRLSIFGNLIHHVASYGIHITGYEKLPIVSTRITVSDNTIDHACQNSSGCAGLKFFGGTFSRTRANQNTIKNTLGWSYCQEKTQGVPGYGIGVFISNASGITLINNNSTNNSGPAFLGYTRQLPTIRNSFIQNTASRSQTGIALHGADGEVDTNASANNTRHTDTTISQNTFIHNATALDIDAATPQSIRIEKNIYKNNAAALSYRDTVISTPSAIHKLFPFWEKIY